MENNIERKPSVEGNSLGAEGNTTDTIPANIITAPATKRMPHLHKLEK